MLLRTGSSDGMVSLRAVSSVGRAIRLHRKGRGFESLTAHSEAKKNAYVLYAFFFWWARRDLNPQPLRDTLLRRTRIPIPPRARAHHDT